MVGSVDRRWRRLDRLGGGDGWTASRLDRLDGLGDVDRLDGWTGSAVARDRRGIGGGWTGSGDGDGWTVDRIGGGLGGGVLGRFEAGRGRQWRGLGGGGLVGGVVGLGDVLGRWLRGWTGSATSSAWTCSVATVAARRGDGLERTAGDVDGGGGGLGGPWRLDRIGGGDGIGVLGFEAGRGGRFEAGPAWIRAGIGGGVVGGDRRGIGAVGGVVRGGRFEAGRGRQWRQPRR